MSSGDLATPAVATSLTIETPPQTTPDTPIVLTGTYQGDPVALDYNIGAGWIAAPAPAFDDGTFSFTLPAGLAVGSYPLQVRDHDAPSVAATGGSFVVSAWTPETLTASPGASVVFEFNANNPALVAGAAGATVTTVVNSVNASQSLTARTGSDGNPIVIDDDSGADGDRRVLQFQSTTMNPNTADPATNWLSAGGVGGSGGSALVGLANSSDPAASGSFTTVIAMYVNKAYSYEAGPIWGTPAEPGPLQYVQLRLNEGSGKQGANISPGGTPDEPDGSVTAGWHVLTMIKDDGTLEYRLDGQFVASAPVTSNAAFAAADFMIGGGFGVGASVENGVPPPYVGEFQAYSGVLAGSDLANAEKLAGSSIGLTLAPTVPLVIALSSPGTVQEAAPADGVAVTETVSAYGMSTIYEAVFTASGSAESGWTPVSLDANGAGSFIAYFANSGDYVKAVNNVSAPTVMGTSAPVTITDPAVPPVLISGTGNMATLTAGETLYDTGSGNNLIFPAAGGVILSGNTINNDDTFDLRAVMATTNWDGIAAELGNYISETTTNAGHDLEVLLHPEGGAASTVLATFTAVGQEAGAFQRFEQNTLFIDPSAVPVVISGAQGTATLASGETLYDTGYDNTLVLPAAGRVKLSGNTVNNGDTFDLRAAMAATNWDGITSELGNYITAATANGGADLEILLHPQGGAASTVLATLTAVGQETGAFASFEQHAIFIDPSAVPVVISGSGRTATLVTGETLYDTGGDNTLVLPAAGPVKLSGNTVNNSDMFDLRAAMATTSWNGNPADLGAYLSSATTNNGADLQVLLSTQPGGVATVLATLTSVGQDPGAFTRFEQHAILTVAAGQPGSATPVFISGPGATTTLTAGELLYDTGGDNTVILPAAGPVTLSGNTVNNGDMFDLRAAMATTNWDGLAADLGNYLTSATTNSGQDLQVLLHPQGGSASSVLATFTSVGADPGAFARFEQHAILTSATA